VKRNALTTVSSAWALVAYLGFLLFAAPCTCFARTADTAPAKVCCCGPDAQNPCEPEPATGEHGGCEGVLGAGCAQELPEATTLDAVSASDEFATPTPAAGLSFALASPEAALVSSSRARAPSLPAPRLDQVRSTVLLI